MPSKRKQVELEVRRVVEEHYIINDEDVPPHAEILISRLQYLVRTTYKEKEDNEPKSRVHRSRRNSNRNSKRT